MIESRWTDDKASSRKAPRSSIRHPVPTGECLLNTGAWMTHDEHGDENGDGGEVIVGRHHLFRGPDGSCDGVDSIERERQHGAAAERAGGDGDMAMDMARLDSSDLDLEFAEAGQHCEAQDESTATAGEQFAELDVVGCLDFDAAVSGISCEDESKGLENLELQEFGELLEAGEGVVNSSAVGEEEALLLAEAAKGGDGCVSVSDSGECSSGERKEGVSPKKAAPGGAKKKAKVDWTPELHRRFVHAVEQLGVEKAFPSRILELMGVQCLTRHNIASHLQKYRSHRRHLAAREAEAASWTHRRAYTHTPWARPSRRDGLPYLVPLHTPHIQPRPLPQPLSAPLKVWGYPTVDHSNVHMWQQPPPPPSFWQAPDGSYWQHPAASYGAPYPHPMRVAPAIAPMVAPGFPDDSAVSFYSDFDSMCQTYDSDLGRAAGVAACSKPPETHLSKEVLDAAIGEALANPWTPPPLGLKPPSMEGVIAELQRQGINTVPPSTC